MKSIKRSSKVKVKLRKDCIRDCGIIHCVKEKLGNSLQRWIKRMDLF